MVDVERQVIQDFIGTAPWDHRPLIEVLVGQVAERLGQPDGIIAFDPSSFPKRGTHSVGVKRQWCGHRGKVDNCQVGVFMGYVSHHDHALLDFRLSLPRTGHGTSNDAKHATCRRRCAIKRGRSSAWRCSTRGGSRYRTAGSPAMMNWVATRGFATQLRERGERYVLGVPCNTTMRDLEAPLPAYAGRGRRPKAPWQSVTHWRQALSDAMRGRT